MPHDKGIDIISRREVIWLVGAGVTAGIVGAILVFSEIVPLRTGLAGSLLAFLALYFGYNHWRYGPLKNAISRIDREDFSGASTILDDYLQLRATREGRPRHLAQVLKASCAFYQGAYDEALEWATQVVKTTDCESIRFFAQNEIVSCHICSHKPLKADAERAKLLTMNVSERIKREALINVGLCYMNAEFFREAIETWEDALELNPDNEQRAYVFGFQAACKNRIRAYDDALEIISKAKSLQPRAELTRAILLDNEAFALANKKERLDEALQMVQDAFELRVPAALPHLHMTAGEVHYARGEFDEGIEELRAAIERIAERDRNSHQKAYLTLGKILQAQGKNEEAREALNKAISIDPTKTMAVHAQQVLQDPGTYNTAMSKPGQVLGD